MAKTSYLNAESLLKEEYALGAKLTQDDILADRTILRYFPNIPAEHVNECLNLIRSRTSVKNSSTKHSVTDPKVNKSPIPGKWHHVHEYAEPRRPMQEPDVLDVFQFLQLGWITTSDALPTPALLTDEKLLLSPFVHDTTSVQNIYVWEYKWIDPAYAQELRNTISLLDGVIGAKVIKTDTGPCSIQVQTQTNTWEGDLSQVWEKQTQSGGFAAEKIVETFSHIPLTSLDTFETTLETPTAGFKVSALTKTADESLGFGRLVQTQDKLFPDTVTADNGTLKEEEYVQLITDGVIRTTMWLGVSDTDLDTAMATVAVAPAGYTVLQVMNNYDGTGSFNLFRIMMLDSSAVPTQLRVEFPEFDDERRTYFYFGLNKTTAESTLVTAKTVCDAGYKVDLVEIQEWRFGALVVIQQISKLNLALTGQVRAYDYTRTFGLVSVATTVYLNIAKASIDGLKTTILADATIIVLELRDDDVGQGKADVIVIWRSKEAAPRSLGAVRAYKAGQFHKTEEDRLWIDVNIDDVDSIKDAVALALAGTAPYAVAASEKIVKAVGEDAGDKTARITQSVIKEDTDEYADYSRQESFNPHGLQEAVMLISVREYPEVAYDNVATIFAALQTFLGDPMKGRIQASMNANDTIAMRGLKEGTPDWANTTPDYVKVATSNKDLIGEKKVELATGVPVEDAAAIVDAATADVDHVIDDIRMTERGQGEAAIEKRQTKKSETAVQVEELPALGLRRAVKNYTWPLVLAANIDTIWTAAETEGVAGDYVLHFRQKNILGNGMYSVMSRVVNCPEVCQNTRIIAYTDNSIVSEKIYQDAAAIPAAEDNAGTEEIVRGGLNLYNKYDYVKTITTARAPKSCAGGTVTWTTKSRTRGEYLTTLYGSNNVVELNYTSGWRNGYDTFTHVVTFHTTAAAAAAAIAGGDKESTMHQVSGNLWMSHKVTHAWTTLNSYSFSRPETSQDKVVSVPKEA